MLNRTAAALYWMCRYLERAESISRLIGVNLQMSLDLPTEGNAAWEALVATTGDLEPFQTRFGEAKKSAVFQFLVFDAENHNSVLECMRLARENARVVREYLPAEAWEGANMAFLNLKQASASAGALAHLDETLENVLSDCRRLEGFLETAFSREEGWYFSQLGRQCERADQTSRLVDVNHRLLGEEGDSDLRWESVLRSASALQMYRRKYRGIKGVWVSEFLLLNEDFPRSVAFCLRSAEEALRAITGTPPGKFRNRAEKILGKLASELRYTEFEDILAGGLHEWLDGFQARLNGVGAEILKEYFETPAPAPLPVAEAAAPAEAVPEEALAMEAEQQQ